MRGKGGREERGGGEGRGDDREREAKTKGGREGRGGYRKNQIQFKT